MIVLLLLPIIATVAVYKLFMNRPKASHQVYVTSNNQLVCLFYNILNRSGKPIPTGWVIDNGSVFRIGRDGSIQMIHPTFVSNPQRFVTPEHFNEVFKDVTLPASEKTIYIVRHGHGIHNEASATIEESRDPQLTELGIEQAQNSGQAIFKDMKDQEVITIDAYCSDLFRTMLTIDIIMEQIPSKLRATKTSVCIEARENIRPNGSVHHWELDDPLRKLAIDPFLPVEDLHALAPGLTDMKIERKRVENLPINDPIGDWDACVKKVGNTEIDWNNYIAKLKRAKNEGKTFGQVASENLFMNVILENATI